MRELRLITYLAPSIPLGLYKAVARHLSGVLHVPVALRSETRTSAPPPGELDPFSTDEADIGFLCAPGYRWLIERTPPAVELVGAAPVFADPRAAGRPVFFSDVIVRNASHAQTLADLRGSVFAYNDPCSLSGYLSAFPELARLGAGIEFFRAVVATGSHPASIRAVATGAADVAAIDSNVLAVELTREPALAGRIRVLTSWGPHTIQPVVARATLAASIQTRITTALLDMHKDGETRHALAGAGVLRFAPVTPADYGVAAAQKVA
jgi:ABC-type phosphate/phosphonate transport system substrate-binding protein